MINVSSDFKAAVNAGRTRVLLTMGGKMIENADIASGGITVTENLGPDNSYTIGNAPAGTIGFSLMNGDGQFSSLSYGELKAVGYALTDEWTHEAETSEDVEVTGLSDYAGTDGQLMVIFDQDIFSVYDNSWEVILELSELTTSVKFVYTDGVKVYFFGSYPVGSVDTPGACLAYVGDGTWGSCNFTWAEWNNVAWYCMTGIYTWEVKPLISDSYMLNKLEKMYQDGKDNGYQGSDIIARCDSGTTIKECCIPDWGQFVWNVWEGCPIGRFDIDKPTQTGGKTIECSGYGLMARLDNIEMDDYSVLFPCTNRTLLARVAADAGLGWNYTTDQTVTFSENYWSGYTARQFVKDCAALDAANAIVDRNGNLTFRRPAANGQSFSESDYSSIEIAEYSVPAITGLSWKNSDADVGINSGTSAEVLTITENNTLADCTDSAKEATVDWILSKVDDVTAYHPIEVDLWVGWHLEAGDIVTIVRNSVSYSIPIFNIEYTITTACRAVVSATGEEHRNDLMETNREQYVSNKKRYELSKTVDGLLSVVYDGDGLVSIINQTASSIKIQANKVELSGYVTLTGLSGGTTVIDGACIQTGTINASTVNVTNLNASNITSGTINGGTYIEDGSVDNGCMGTNSIDNDCLCSGSVYETTCNQTINDYFADIAEFNRLIAGSISVSYLSATYIQGTYYRIHDTTATGSLVQRKLYVKSSGVVYASA